jgi:chemotaxis protein MotA
MDIATVIGLILGGGLVAWIIVGGGNLALFLDAPSLAIVVGGTIATTLISFPMKQVLNVMKVVRHAFFSKPADPRALIKDLVRYAEVARRDGILSLENLTRESDNKFLVSGIQLAVDGTDPALIEQVLISEVESVAERHANGKAVLDSMARFAPAFGMIGTLLGLVLMLSNMHDPDAVGPGMAVALLTTLYGALLANMLFLPLAEKLAVRSNDEILMKTIAIRGVMSIQSGDNPRIVEQRLKMFLPPSLREAEELGRRQVQL